MLKTTIEIIVIFSLMSNLLMWYATIWSKCHIYLIGEEDLRNCSYQKNLEERFIYEKEDTMDILLVRLWQDNFIVYIMKTCEEIDILHKLDWAIE